MNMANICNLFIVRLFKQKRYKYPILDTGDDMYKEYYARFGISVKKRQDGTPKYKITNRKKLEMAYNRAWDTRNFEIERYWQRTAYFWGFIVIIFGGYISIITKNNDDGYIIKNLSFNLIALGLIFTIGWFLVIVGSKTWQLNWESHIDMLERFISGPLYRTVYYRGRFFYSVSKINEVLSVCVFFVWLSLFIEYLLDYKLSISLKNVDWNVSITVLLIVLMSIIMIFGYPLSVYKSEKGKFFDRYKHEK